MLLLSYCVNLAVLVPLLAAFAFAKERMDAVYGPDTDARRILVCVYASIALMSGLGLWVMFAGDPDLSAQLGVVLFAVQVSYKMLTVFLVGLRSPVVISNLAVVFVHLITLWTLVFWGA